MTGNRMERCWNPRDPEKRKGERLQYLKIVIIVLLLLRLNGTRAGRAQSGANLDVRRLRYLCLLEKDPALGGQPERDLA